MNIEKGTIEKLMARCKAAWVKWLVGALVGALAAAGVLTVTGCTASYTRDAAGAVSWTGAVVLPVRNNGK